jgi:hypothetical protein
MKHLNLKINQLSFITFAILYSLYGSSTTPKIRFLEIMLIILIIGTLNLKNIISFIKDNFHNLLFINFLVILMIGLVVALFNENKTTNIFRDFIFYGYIGFFFYISNLIKKNLFDIRSILFFIFFVAIFFLSRSFYISHSLDFDLKNLIIEKNYLIININTLFVACLLPLLIIDFLKEKSSKKYFLIFFSIIFIFSYLFFCNQLSIRSSLFVYLTFLFYLLLNIFIKKRTFNYITFNKYKKFNSIFLIIFLIFLLFIFNITISDGMIYKLSHNFFNNRLSEYSSVKNNLNSYSEIIFGKGIGSVILSNTTGAHSNFFHSFFLHFYYKHGLLGLLFSLFFCLKIFKEIFNSILLLNPIAVAGFLPFFYGLSLSTSYKTLEFWMLIVLITYKKIEKIHGSKSN